MVGIKIIIPGDKCTKLLLIQDGGVGRIFINISIVTEQLLLQTTRKRNKEGKYRQSNLTNSQGNRISLLHC